MTREQAREALAAAGYETEADGLLALADRFPMYHYTADRHRCVVRSMPSGEWDVVDCAASEDMIKAIPPYRRPW